MPLYTTSLPNLSVAGNSAVTGNETVGGTLGVTGNTTLSGTLAVTGNTTMSASAHVAGSLAGHPSPSNHNVVAWSYDPSLSTNSSLLTNGTVYLSALYIPRTVSVTKIYWWVSTIGATPTASQNFVGLYDSAGNRLATTNVDSDITSSTLKTTTISSQSLTAGSFYWVGMVFNAATAPTISRGTGNSGASTGANLGLATATLRYATNGTGQTSLPTSITPASNTASSFAGPWVAIGT